MREETPNCYRRPTTQAATGEQAKPRPTGPIDENVTYRFDRSLEVNARNHPSRERGVTRVTYRVEEKKSIQARADPRSARARGIWGAARRGKGGRAGGRRRRKGVARVGSGGVGERV
jgi:hypothetical protein